MASGYKPLMWCAWPGLRQLWLRGSVPALALAVGLSGLLNLLLLSSLLWTQWLSPTAHWAGWGTLLGAWGLAAVATWYTAARDERTAARASVSGNTGEPDPLALAIDEYLQGKWFETENILRKVLRRDRRDVEARLMMATLCRHTGRLDEAERRLTELTALEAAAKWQTEIQLERQLLEERSKRNQQSEDEKSPSAEPSVEARNEAPPGTPDMTKAA